MCNATAIHATHHASMTTWVASLKNTFNIVTGISSLPDIKLIRTDTTLDLSQKAEKGMTD